MHDTNFYALPVPIVAVAGVPAVSEIYRQNLQTILIICS